MRRVPPSTFWRSTTQGRLQLSPRSNGRFVTYCGQKARQLGSGSQTTGFTLLVEEVAYVQWHRMLFARFLDENNLLMHPTGVAVTLEDCEELAARRGRPGSVGNRGSLRRQHAAGHLLASRSQRPSEVRARGPGSARGCPEHPPQSCLHVGRRPWLGVSILAVEEEEGSQRQRAKDREARPGCLLAALHRGLHGAVLAGELARCMVGRTAS